METRNAFTVDLEDWYQGLTSTAQKVERWPNYESRVVENTERILNILEQAGIKATFFILGYVADQFSELITRVASQGHEIGLHGYHHQFVSRITEEEFLLDVQRGRSAVEAASGHRIIGYRAPYFSINRSTLWVFTALQHLGFRYDSSVFPTRNILYGYPEAPRLPYFPIDGENFVEFPLSTITFMGMNFPFAGGFYMRLMPYPLFKKGLEWLNRNNQPAILYIHPWELDPDQPRLNPTLRERFTHYYGLRWTEEKLISLLRDFEFSPLANLLIDPFRPPSQVAA